ncbi:nucleotide-binding universal stress UspA family protein [Glaciihabitans tibetensis]|uniref:Nucleotide-binding universal stress UspA family protein n=1 Tax=Glaciihabitans tibetensis TaxID=1266600 RepID=A0A2T0VFW7_9MICO|nr:universal stress protein [Glaciihabitans tibetensis]PRY69093.1 nucleotide-binding universal stress UspA family protein [Glaciihabitans tibetensis]
MSQPDATTPDDPAGSSGSSESPGSSSASSATTGSSKVSSADSPDESTAGEGTSVDRVVVGHDGSPSSDSALELALEISEKMAIPLLIMRSWTVDSAPHGALFSHGYVSTFDEVSTLIRANLITETRRFVDRHPAAEVHYYSTLGQAANALLKLSKGARMLVVGSRGRGGFASLMLGSVSDQCVRHAGCPVLVSRPRVPAEPATPPLP